MIIGVDLDEVCAEYYEGLRDFIALEDNLTPDVALSLYPNPDTYNMQSWKDFPDKFVEVHERAVNQGLYQKLKPIAGASEVLWKLNNEGHHLRVITSRFVLHGQHSKVLSHTAEWLDFNDIPYRDISFVARKGDIFADVYIDDSPTNIHVFNELKRKVIIFDRLYNKDIEGLRAHNWDDVYNIITMMNKK